LYIKVSEGGTGSASLGGCVGTSGRGKMAGKGGRYTCM
jgi:hypothetical protein